LKLQIRADWLEQLTQTVNSVVANSVASRIFAKDATVWGAAAEPEASIRLGWVNAHQVAASVLQNLEPIRESWLAHGVKRVVLCGMGGSSLAPEVMAKKFALPLTILDATSPDQVAAAFRESAAVAVVIASKSGSTVETDSHRRFALDQFREANIDARDRMLIITDPGSPLDSWARGEGIPVVNADPAVGGRYSALTAFGLAPFFLAGGEAATVVAQAESTLNQLSSDSPENPAIWLAALMASLDCELTSGGHRDKLLLSAADLPGLPDWVEQLVAESTGKEGAGTLPVAVESDAIDLRRELPDTLRIRMSEKETSGPILASEDVTLQASLGEQFLLWETATAILGYLLGINPFDQPDVESAKQAARGLLDQPKQQQVPTVVDGGCAIRGFNLGQFGTLESALDQLSHSLPKDGYLALLTFASRLENPTLETLRSQFAVLLGRPVSFGWGPRYLHSTGQYHKGGPNQGAFLQIRIRSDFDIAVPGQPYTFADLLRAQADGDAEVLAAKGRPVLILEFADALSAHKALRAYCERGEQ